MNGARLLVCINVRDNPAQPSCGARDGAGLANALERLLAERGLDLPVERIACLGHCADGPNVRLAPGGAYFHRVDHDDLPRLVAAVAAALGSEPGS